MYTFILENLLNLQYKNSQINYLNNISSFCHHGNGLLFKNQQMFDFHILAKRFVLQSTQVLHTYHLGKLLKSPLKLR